MRNVLAVWIVGAIGLSIGAGTTIWSVAVEKAGAKIPPSLVEATATRTAFAASAVQMPSESQSVRFGQGLLEPVNG